MDFAKRRASIGSAANERLHCIILSVEILVGYRCKVPRAIAMPAPYSMRPDQPWEQSRTGPLNMIDCF